MELAGNSASLTPVIPCVRPLRQRGNSLNLKCRPSSASPDERIFCAMSLSAVLFIKLLLFNSFPIGAISLICLMNARCQEGVFCFVAVR